MNSFMSWLKNPLGNDSGKPDGFHLFLLIGFLILCLVAWGFIFRHIRAAI